MQRILVLGSGLVGHAVAADLCREFSVHVADADLHTLEAVSSSFSVTPVHADLADSRRLKQLTRGFDVVVNALPGHMGFGVLKDLIDNGNNVVDIAFSPEDPFLLEDRATKAGVTAVVDCGVAPGLCNMILGYESTRLDAIESYSCLVGGLPVERQWPWEYKAGFSPADVIEEYTRPCRMVQNGKPVVYPPLSGLERVEFKGIGTLEAFHTDGLRTLLKTMKIPNMKEKTLRYPGHAALMEILGGAGFFSREEMEIKNQRLAPLDVTSAILFPQWKMRPDEADFTVMRIDIKGKSGNNPVHRAFELFDQFDWKTRTTSMARTTGYTCSAVVRILAEGRIRRRGVVAPEHLGQMEGVFKRVRKLLEERGVKLSGDL
ncbi:MAG TPA: saccharopine dehydrogenase [Candidatus Aminicenantes bacterium]|nr:saccharopine dehydrogenase [Candidatus Aminicenantes bacterium]